jgi:predicted acetyltransferase
MADINIRTLSLQEAIDAIYTLGSYAFEPSPPLADRAEWDETLSILCDGATVMALFEDGAPVSIAASSPFRQNLRGEIVGTGGIWAVATDPAARRRGYSSRVMAALLKAVREDGLAHSCLWPFREAFYAEMGYVAFPQPRRVAFALEEMQRLPKQDFGGRVQRRLIADGWDDCLAQLQAAQRRIHGFTLAEPGEMEKMAKRRNKSWLATAHAGGEIIGMMIYHITGTSDHLEEMVVSRFYYATSQGRYLLLDWIARHAGHVEKVAIILPAFEQPETWLVGAVRRLETLGEAPMARVIDVMGLAGLPAGPGSFTARIIDRFCPWNEGVYRFEGVEGRLAVSPAKSAGCELDIRGLTALLFGLSDPADYVYRGWGNPDPAAQAAMRAMFPALQPHIHLEF